MKCRDPLYTGVLRMRACVTDRLGGTVLRMWSRVMEWKSDDVHQRQRTDCVL